VQAAQAMAPATIPDAALVTGSTDKDPKTSGKHHHSHRDNGASP